MVLPNVTGCGDNIPKPGSFMSCNTQHEIIYFPKGSPTLYYISGHTYLLSERCITITPAGDEYGYTFSHEDPIRHMYVNFDYGPDASNEVVSPLFQSGGRRVVNIPEYSIIEGVMTHILYLAGTEPEESRERRNRALYLLVAEIEGLCNSQCSSAHSDMPLTIVRTVEYIEERLPLPITIAELVRESKWSYGHFCREFVRYIGVPPQEYISMRRVEYACRLLIESKDSIKEVSASVGFEDPNYFSRFFSKHKGISATQYRERHSDVRAHAMAMMTDKRTPYPLNRFIVLD